MVISQTVETRLVRITAYELTEYNYRTNIFLLEKLCDQTECLNFFS